VWLRTSKLHTILDEIESVHSHDAGVRSKALGSSHYHAHLSLPTVYAIASFGLFHLRLEIHRCFLLSISTFSRRRMLMVALTSRFGCLRLLSTHIIVYRRSLGSSLLLRVSPASYAASVHPWAAVKFDCGLMLRQCPSKEHHHLHLLLHVP